MPWISENIIQDMETMKARIEVWQDTVKEIQRQKDHNWEKVEQLLDKYLRGNENYKDYVKGLEKQLAQYKHVIALIEKAEGVTIDIWADHFMKGANGGK